jgi:hypothetical protein
VKRTIKVFSVLIPNIQHSHVSCFSVVVFVLKKRLSLTTKPRLLPPQQSFIQNMKNENRFSFSLATEFFRFFYSLPNKHKTRVHSLLVKKHEHIASRSLYDDDDDEEVKERKLNILYMKNQLHYHICVFQKFFTHSYK